MGDSGAGKTEVACAILAESVAHLPNALCRFATFGDVLRSIRSTYDDVLRSEWQAIGQWAGFRILCIDDLGKEKPTADALEKMFTVLDARYRSGKPTLFTTQYQSPKELGIGSWRAEATSPRRRRSCGACSAAGSTRRK